MQKTVLVIGIIFLLVGLSINPTVAVMNRDDDTPPVTTIDIIGIQGENGWYKSKVFINLTATNDSSGVNTTFYRINVDLATNFITSIRVWEIKNFKMIKYNNYSCHFEDKLWNYGINYNNFIKEKNLTIVSWKGAKNLYSRTTEGNNEERPLKKKNKQKKSSWNTERKKCWFCRKWFKNDISIKIKPFEIMRAKDGDYINELLYDDDLRWDFYWYKTNICKKCYIKKWEGKKLFPIFLDSIR